MKVGDMVRYTSTGDALGMGIILNLGARNDELYDLAEVVWSGEVRGMPIRWISFEYLEVINENR